MTTMRSIAARAKLVAAVTTLLILIGAGGAAAYWTASAQLEGSAKAAKVGITQTRPSGLQKTYTSGNLRFADTVTITNESTRDAELKVTVGSTQNAALPDALSISVFPLAAGEQCTTATRSEAAVHGRPGLTLTRELAGRSSVMRCVQTSLPPRGVFLFPGTQTELTVTSSLTYADGDAWTISAGKPATAPLVQKVSQDPTEGARKLTCDDGTFSWDPLNVYPLTLDFTRPSGTEAMDYRVHLSRNGQVVQVAPQAVDIVHGRNGATTAEISKRVLAEAGWKSMSGSGDRAWVFIEYKPRSAGDEAWTSGGVGSLDVANYIANPDGVTCT